MTSRIGAKGQVVIPKELRDRTGLHPGAEVDFELRDDDAVVLVAHRGRTELAGRFSKSGMASRLLADRAAEPQ
jgi:AbrB family looped-hinge helix DNA binding protein